MKRGVKFRNKFFVWYLIIFQIILNIKSFARKVQRASIRVTKLWCVGNRKTKKDIHRRHLLSRWMRSDTRAREIQWAVLVSEKQILKRFYCSSVIKLKHLQHPWQRDFGTGNSSKRPKPHSRIMKRLVTLSYGRVLSSVVRKISTIKIPVIILFVP